MIPFRYTAYTATGARKRGVILADDAEDAGRRLEAQGLSPAEISAEAAAQRPAFWRRGARVDAASLSVITRQMAVLLGAGLDVEAALAAVQGAAVSPGAERLLAATRGALQEGMPLHEALSSAGGAAIPAWYAAALGAGERSGELAAVFGTLADFLEGSEGERAALATALAYPAFVALVALTVCAVLMTTVAPELASLFAASGQPLPPLTLAVMGATDWVIGHWPLLAALLALLVALGIASGRIENWRARRDALSLKLPMIGRLRRRAEAAHYLRTLALVVNARLPLTEALDFAANVPAIATHRSAGHASAEALRRGDSLATALRPLEFLHPVSRQLLEAGEASARLGPMASRAALLAESWMRSERKRLLSVLEPMAMVLVGLAVLVIVMAILLPVFDMQGMVEF